MPVNLAHVGDAARSRRHQLVAAAGWPAVVTVACAGVTAGFLTWYAYLTHGPHRTVLLETSLVLALIAGPLLALGLWDAYARKFAHRTDISYAAALRWDVPSWSALALLWLILAPPGGLSTQGRAVALALALFFVAKLLVAARFNATVRDVLVTFVVTRVPIIIIAELAAVIVGQRAGNHYSASENPFLAIWGRWDAEHYIGIATAGYSGTEPAFFPLYPLLIWFGGKLTGNHLLAGLFISNAASLFALLYLYKLVEHEFNRQVAHRTIFYVSIFPTAIFFSAVYTESLFLCLSVASFYYVRERRWMLAGTFGFLAALTRVEGVLMAVPFLIEWGIALYEARRDWFKWPLDSVIKPLIGILLMPLGLAAYMAYLWVLRGDPLYFSHVQAHWGRYLAPPWVSFGHAIGMITGDYTPQTIANQLLEVTFTVLMLAVILIGFRRLRASYIAYMAVSILVPLSTSSLMSMPRFALVLFPMFVLFGLWGAKPTVNNIIVAFSLPLLGLFTVLFADWYWVA
ncbi:MAG TPA: glycosyltransferase family 39 protein [Candidatus Lustribacter sp.]